VSLAAGLLGLITAWALGRAVTTAPLASRRDALLRECLALGAGLGLCSGLYFLLLPLRIAVPWPARILHAAAELLLLLALGIAALRLRWESARKRALRVSEESMRGGRASPRPLLWAMAPALAVALALTALALLRAHGWFPHGGWDAWDFWNTKARFLYRGGASWHVGFQAPISHPDYPLFLPTTVARLWMYAGAESPAVSGLVGPVFLALSCGVLGGAVGACRGAAQAMLAVATLLGLSFYTLHAASQYAEPPLAFFILAATALLALAHRRPASRPGLLALSGFFAGCAAWTKNEGLVFAAAATASLGAVALWRVGGRGWIWLGRYATGLVPMLALVGGMKTMIAHHTPALAKTPTQGSAVLGRLLDLEQHGTIWYGFWVKVLGHPEHAVLFALAAYAGAAGIAPLRRRERFVAGQAVSAVALLLGGYDAFYLLAQLGIDNAIMMRLFANAWPALVLSVFLLLRRPEALLRAAAGGSARGS
jgi:hypothetical protein